MFVSAVKFNMGVCGDSAGRPRNCRLCAYSLGGEDLVVDVIQRGAVSHVKCAEQRTPLLLDLLCLKHHLHHHQCFILILMVNQYQNILILCSLLCCSYKSVNLSSNLIFFIMCVLARLSHHQDDRKMTKCKNDDGTP